MGVEKRTVTNDRKKRMIWRGWKRRVRRSA